MMKAKEQMKYLDELKSAGHDGVRPRDPKGDSCTNLRGINYYIWECMENWHSTKTNKHMYILEEGAEKRAAMEIRLGKEYVLFYWCWQIKEDREYCPALYEVAENNVPLEM